MNDQDQYGRYIAQQPQQIHSNGNNSYNGFDNTRSYYDSDYTQSSTGSGGQQQMMYGEYGENAEQHGEGRYPQNEGHGVQEYYAGSGEKLQLSPPRRKHRSWLWYMFIPVMICFLAGGLFGMHDRLEGSAMHSWPPMMGKGQHHDFQQFGPPALNTSSQAFPYNGSTLRINVVDNNGSVRIESNSDVQQVTVNVQSLDGQNAENVPLKFDPNAGQLSFDASQFGPGYNVTIDVPGSVNTIDTQVQSGSGDVNVEGISGQVNVESQDGSITLSQDNLSGQSSIKTQHGSIDFNGSLSQQGSYDFESVTGSINLQLPSNASFHLVNSSGNINNEFNNNDEGSSPRPSLSVSSQGGDITISPGQ